VKLHKEDFGKGVGVQDAVDLETYFLHPKCCLGNNRQRVFLDGALTRIHRHVRHKSWLLVGMPESVNKLLEEGPIRCDWHQPV
jgi:hypothetical protein